VNLGCQDLHERRLGVDLGVEVGVLVPVLGHGALDAEGGLVVHKLALKRNASPMHMYRSDDA
jgi:hypothetical protein